VEALVGVAAGDLAVDHSAAAAPVGVGEMSNPKPDWQKELAVFAENLHKAAGENLVSLVLFGSAAGSDYHPQHSDINLLAVLNHIDVPALEKLAPVVREWRKADHPAPLLFTPDELKRGADVFAIELLDVKAQRKILAGQDIFESLEVPLAQHHLQVERELRHHLVHLRQHFLGTAGDSKNILQLMAASVSAFATLFRHALIALGLAPAQSKRQAINELATHMGFSPTPFMAILDFREGSRTADSINVATTFATYLEAVELVTAEVDRRLDQRTAKP
jgi:predicted nucleotidyltransferase